MFYAGSMLSESGLNWRASSLQASFLFILSLYASQRMPHITGRFLTSSISSSTLNVENDLFMLNQLGDWCEGLNSTYVLCVESTGGDENMSGTCACWPTGWACELTSVKGERRFQFTTYTCRRYSAHVWLTAQFLQ